MNDYSRGSLGEVRDAQQLRISEVFSSLQGEGPSSGAPCVFVRLALCNLRCSWCDTKYTWDFERYSYADEVTEVPVAQLAAELTAAPEQRVVLTGGEPLLQQAGLARLLQLIPASVAVEVETNGTLAPDEALLARVDQWNVSPKLAHAGDALARRLRPAALAALAASTRAYLKFVVRGAADMAELDALVEQLGWPRERVFLMPEATSAAEHADRAPEIAALCQAHGYRFSARLHVLLWGGERGR